MTRIDPQLQVRQLLQAEVTALRQRQAGPAQRQPAASRWQVPPAALQRIRAIPRDAPDRRQRALRIFLESVLLRELGETTVHDPAFPQLVDAVQRQMQDDPQLAATLQRAEEVLLSA